MRMVLLAALISLACSAVAKSDTHGQLTMDLAKREGFVCGQDFVTMRHTKGGTFETEGLLLTIRKAAIYEVWTFGSGGSSVWLKGKADKAPSRVVNISSATSTALRACLEDHLE